MASDVTDTNRLARRPIDPAKGLPIPFAAETAEGTADFSAIQGAKTLACATRRLCGVCGEKLDYWIVFLGGPQAAVALTYTDPPMHEACAEASTVLCPHIAHKKPQRSRKLPKRDDVVTPAGFVEEKPPGYVMVFTRDFTYRIFEQGALIYRAGTVKRRRYYSYNDEGILQFDREERA